MKKIKLLPLILLLTSCSEVLYLTVEQMLPPEVTPKKMARSVGVVNNFSQNNVVIINEDTEIYPCNADLVKDEIAQSFADAGVLDRVVVLDSLLYHPDSITPHILSQTEVNDLCHQLDVEMLYSIEYACLTYNRAHRLIGRPLNLYLCSRTYTPDTDSVGGTKAIDKKMIERWVDTQDEIDSLMPQIPTLFAETAIEPYLPSWKERERVFYYDRLCYELREARVHVKEGNWEAAGNQWRALSTSKQRIRRFASAYNMALYYEMNDSIDQAIASLDLAKEIAIKKDKRDDTEYMVIDTFFLDQYREVLVTRKREIELIEEYWQSQ